MKSPVALAAVLLSVTALTASAQAVKVEFLMGKVNLKAQNASLRAVLTEWGRVGGTRIVNPERLAGQPVTLELVGVPERQALDILLRDVGGFMLGPRQSLVPGVSAYDRIVVVSGAAGRPAATAPPFNASAQPVRRAPPPRVQPPQDDDIDEDQDDVDGPVPIGPVGPATRSAQPGLVTPGLPPLPEVSEPRSLPAPTSPRGNPFGAQGSTRPGQIAPVAPPTPTEQRSPSEDPDR